MPQIENFWYVEGYVTARWMRCMDTIAECACAVYFEYGIDPSFLTCFWLED